MIWSAQVISQDIFEYYNLRIFDLNIKENIVKPEILTDRGNLPAFSTLKNVLKMDFKYKPAAIIV